MGSHSSETMEKIISSGQKFTDEELTRMAIEELNREIVKASARAELSGNKYLPPCPLKKANKRFLNTTIKSALNFNKQKGSKTRLNSMKKLVEITDRIENPESTKKPKKFGERIHVFKKKKSKDKDKSKSHKPTSSTDVIVID